MTNYLDEYNKRMTHGNAMGFNASPLAQTAHMHADRDRAQPQTGGAASSRLEVTLGNKDGKAGLGRALLILFCGLMMLSLSVWMIEEMNGLFQIIGMALALAGLAVSGFGVMATFVTGLVSIGQLIRQKIFWGIVTCAGIAAYALSAMTGLYLFAGLMLGWGVFTGGKKLLNRRAATTPVSTTDSP